MKTTHQLLQPQPPAPSEPSSFILLTDPKKLGSSILDTTFSTSEEERKRAENRPTQGSAGGMAIRTVAVAQADHM